MVTRDELRSIMDAIWESLAGDGLPELPADGDGAGDGGTGASSGPDGRPRLVGRVEITGQWEGAVTIDCDAELAARIAAVMFGMEDGGAEPDEIRDALGELANMAGGNIKSLLPAPSQLSLPTVSDPSEEAADADAAHSVSFDVDGMRIMLSLVQLADA